MGQRDLDLIEKVFPRLLRRINQRMQHKPELPIYSGDFQSFRVHCGMVMRTQQQPIIRAGDPTLRPVLVMMNFAQGGRRMASWHSTPSIAGLNSTPEMIRELPIRSANR